MDNNEVASRLRKALYLGVEDNSLYSDDEILKMTEETVTRSIIELQIAKEKLYENLRSLWDKIINTIGW